MLLKKLHSFFQEQGFKRSYCLAFSGGLDSQVLLHLLVSLRKEHPFVLRAVHVHHGFSAFADAWAEYCQCVCESLEVSFELHRLSEKPQVGESLEEFARKARYRYFEAQLKRDEVLLTAHHEDDQAETLLLQLFRGAGPKGLASMPIERPLGQGSLARPLLSVTRAELQDYAKAMGLSWIEDEMNEDLSYSRNYLRHQLLPLLREHWPSVTKAIARSARLCGESQEVLEVMACEALESLAGGVPGTLSVQGLLAFSPEKQRLVLRAWIEREGFLLPSEIKLKQVQETVLLAKPDAKPCVEWGGVELRRFQGDLYLMKALVSINSHRAYEWDLKLPLKIEGVGVLEARPSKSGGMRPQPLRVAFRQGGELIQLPNGHHHDLKKFFQEKAVPPWERERLPLIFVDGELAAIPGYWIGEAYKAKPGEPGVELLII